MGLSRNGPQGLMDRCSLFLCSDYSKSGIALTGVRATLNIPTKEHHQCSGLFIYYYLLLHLILSVTFISLPWTMFSGIFSGSDILYIPKISLSIKRKLSIFKLMKHDIFSLSAYHYTSFIKLSISIERFLTQSILREILPSQKTLYSSNSRFSKQILEK